MKLNLTSTFQKVYLTNATLQFTGSTAVCLGSIDSDGSYLTYESGDTIYNISGECYLKALGTTYNSVIIEDKVKSTRDSGAVNQHAKDVTHTNISQYYTFSVAPGDFVTNTRSSNGQQFTEVSIDPLSDRDTQTVIEYQVPFNYPCTMEISASMSQRTKGDYAVIEITDKDTSYVDAPIEYSIVASYTNKAGTVVTSGQNGTTLTLVLDSAFDGYLGSWVDCYGFLDNKFNYTNLAVATISADKRALTFTTSDEATIPSFTANPASVVGAKLKRQAKLLGAANAVGMRFTGTSSTNAAYFARFGRGSIKEVGTLTGSRLATCSSTSVTYTSGNTGQIEIKPTSKFKINVDPEAVEFEDKAIDATNATFSPRNIFTEVKPFGDLDYYVRFRAVSPKSISKPIAKIVSATKTGTTTATIVTDVPHNLNTASYVQVYGIKDQTNFGGYFNTVASVINSTTFTIVMGTSATATSYGGAVILCNGQVTQQGLIPQVVQSVARDSIGLVTLVGSGTWAGFGGVGEYVNIYGLRADLTGVDLGFDGVYKVHNASGTTLTLEPVKDLYGNLVLKGLGQPVTPTGGVVTTTNCGGVVILRTTLRIHDFLLATYSQSVTKIWGQGSNRVDAAIPVINGTGNTLNVATTESTLVTPSTASLTTLATTNIVSAKTTAGTVYNINFTNTSASIVYLKLYNKASAPVLASDVPIVVISIAANSFYTAELGRAGLRFSAGIAYAITGAIGFTDTTAIAAGSLLTISYI